MKVSLQKQIECCRRRGGDCLCVNPRYDCAVMRSLNRGEANAQKKLQEIKLEEYAVMRSLNRGEANAQKKLQEIKLEEYAVEQEFRVTENARDLLGVPIATLREDFKFRETGTPTLVFDGSEVQFGYEDDEGEFEAEEGVWPFTAERVWGRDCEKLGFRIIRIIR